MGVLPGKFARGVFMPSKKAQTHFFQRGLRYGGTLTTESGFVGLTGGRVSSPFRACPTPRRVGEKKRDEFSKQPPTVIENPMVSGWPGPWGLPTKGEGGRIMEQETKEEHAQSKKIAPKV